MEYISLGISKDKLDCHGNKHYRGISLEISLENSNFIGKLNCHGNKNTREM